MSKSISLVCPKCGKNQCFNLEAGTNLGTLTDAASFVSDVEDVLINVMNLKNILTPEQFLFFSQNLADGLSNINYSAFEKRLQLFDAGDLEKAALPAYEGKVLNDLEQSKAKWTSILNKYGVVAFNAIYMCDKCGKAHNKMFLQIKYILDKKEKTFVLSHKCSCGNPLTIVDDQNCSFLNIGMQTQILCECATKMTVDKITFSK